MASHRPYKCNVSACGKEFKLKAQLARHHAVSHAPGSVVTASPTLTVTANSGGGGGPQSLVVGSGSGAGSAVSALVSAGIGGGVGGGSTALNSFAPHRSGSPRPIMKTRAAFYFSAPASLRLARRICADVLKLKHSARFPFYPLNVTAFKQECMFSGYFQALSVDSFFLFFLYRLCSSRQGRQSAAANAPEESRQGDGRVAPPGHAADAQARVADCPAQG